MWTLSRSFQETPADVLRGSAAAARTVRPESDSHCSSRTEYRFIELCGCLASLIKQGGKRRSRSRNLLFFSCFAIVNVAAL